MRLRDIDFGRVSGASGVQGFFGEGYRFHKPLKVLLNLDFTGMTFTAKTTTLHERAGNMPLNHKYMPQEWSPKCIVVKPFKGVALNAVGLSGPGVSKLLSADKWQKRQEPFFLSFMSVAKTPEERKEELRAFVRILQSYQFNFQAPFALQLNYSCPNTGLHPKELSEEIWAGLSIASKLDIPLLPKVNVLFPVEAAGELEKHFACDGFCISNTLLWGALPERIPWKKLFGSETSPLASLGGGGLSGKPLFPLVVEWYENARKHGLKKPVNLGGGILHPQDALFLLKLGVDAVSIGSMAFLRPWNVQPTIDMVNNYKK